MGLFNGLLRGVAAAGVMGLVAKLVNDHGGLEGMSNTLKEKGLASAVQSWIGTGENEPVTPQQMHSALGSRKLKELSKDSGMTTEEVARELSSTLPKVVDRFSPNGTLPPQNPFAGGQAALKEMIE